MDSVDYRLPSIMLLGTRHWSNPGLDYLAAEVDDMLAPDRQRQIASVLQSLQAFAPTHVGIEVMSSRAAEINDDYRHYREESLALTANERHQLGFRMAALMEHDGVHAVDWHNLERPIGWDEAIDFALHHGQQDFVTGFTDLDDEERRARYAAEEAERVRRMSVREQLLEMNDMEAADVGHRAYADMALVGEGADYTGADVILRWYERNMKIFVNIARISKRSDDRILVVIGGGHLPLLSHFITLSGRFRLVSPIPFLQS